MQHPPKKTRRRGASRHLAVVLCAAALVLAAALTLALPAIRERYLANTTQVDIPGPGFRTLGDLAVDEVDSVIISHLEGDSFTLRMQNGLLYLERDGELQSISESHEAELRRVVTQFSVENTVTDQAAEVHEHLSDMGLQPPQATAVIRLTSGAEMTVELGTGVPQTTYFYYRWSGAEGIYMCDNGVAETLMVTQSRLIPVEQPEINKTLITGATLETATEALSMTFSLDAAGYVSGALTSPIAYPMDSSSAAALLTAFSNFRLGTREEPLTEEAQARYGFDQPLLRVTLTQGAGLVSAIAEDGSVDVLLRDASSVSFVVGRAEGDFFYTCLYEGDCYLISRFLVETLVNATSEGLITRHPTDMGGALLSRVLIEAPGGIVDLTATRTERVSANNELETDEDGNVLYDTEVLLNGRSVPPEQLELLDTRLAAMTVSGNAPDGWTVPDGVSPRWRIELETSGGTVRTVEAYRLDAFADVLVVNGEAMHCAHVEAIDLVLADLLAGA